MPQYTTTIRCSVVFPIFLDGFAGCIAVSWGDGFLSKQLHSVVGVFSFGIFQLDDVAMPHVLVDFGQRKQEDVRIACLRVLFRNRMVEAVLRCHGEGENRVRRLRPSACRAERSNGAGSRR